MKILVIGASGMLARPVIKHLDAAGFQLRLFSRTANQSMFDKPYEIVQGNVLNKADVEKAMQNCDAVHLSLSKTSESLAAKTVVNVAKQNGIKIISTISGSSVAEENRWFGMINDKYLAERTIIDSGIPFMIFRATWFFESLNLMVRNGKAMVLGKQPHPSHWVAADDYGNMVANAYQTEVAGNKIFYVHGPEPFLMKDILGKYCKHLFPEIKKVSVVPLPLLKSIAILTQNKELKNAVAMFAYFQKVKETGNPDETNALLGKPNTTFDEWIKSCITSDAENTVISQGKGLEKELPKNNLIVNS